MIDSEGFRANVGIIITNQQGQLLWAKRHAQNAWQFPQGGVDEGETPKQAMYRELYEEVGLKPEDVKILKQTDEWYRYRLPPKYIRQGAKPLCVGQNKNGSCWNWLVMNHGSASIAAHTLNLIIGAG